MSESFEEFKKYLPHYLSSDEQKKLYEDLKGFPDNSSRIASYVANSSESFFLQGECCSGALYFGYDPASGDIKKATHTEVLIVSNSCDISCDNTRMNGSNVTVCPLIKISKYKSMLATEGINQTSIESHVAELKKQKITHLFYIGVINGEEYFAMLDRPISYPANSLPPFSNKFIKLTQYGFYIFLLKLSIHFCRMQDKADRAS